MVLDLAKHFYPSYVYHVHDHNLHCDIKKRLGKPSCSPCGLLYVRLHGNVYMVRVRVSLVVIMAVVVVMSSWWHFPYALHSPKC